MDVYLSPQKDERYHSDMERLLGCRVVPIVLSFKERFTVADAVSHLCAPDCRRLVLPDDYRRHNELIEHVKACAYHIGLEVVPLSRYLDKKPAPVTASVHANAVAAGVG